MIRRFPIRPGDPPLTPGRVYHRKIRGLPGRPAIRITKIAEQRLRDVTHRDALTEGYSGNRALDRFRRDWVRSHDALRWRTASDADVDVRFRTHHAARLVLVATFDLVDPVRNLPEQRDILSGRTAHGQGNGQYVPSGGIDPELEAVDPAVLDAFVAAALSRRIADHADARAAKSTRRRDRVMRYRQR